MLDDEHRRAVAGALLRAQSERVRIPLPSRRHPNLGLDDAYAIQRHLVELHIARGAVHVGYKVGLTSRAMQAALDIDEPQFGHLFDMCLHQDGARIEAAGFLKPRLEVELAFVLGADIEGTGVRIHDVLRVTDVVMPALEIADCRTEAPRPVADMVSDNMGGAGAVLGGRPVRPMDLDLRWVAAILSRNGMIEESGVAAAVMGHPAAGVAALARKMAIYGMGLKKGQIILAGSFTRQIEVAAGDVVHADYGPLGTIGVSFV